MSALDKIQQHLLQIEKDPEVSRGESIHAICPSAQWNTMSWSYCLLKDLLLWKNFYDAILFSKEKRSFIRDWVYKKWVFQDRFSYHGDASRKIYLLKVLKEKKRSSRILIPEVGPCGFDVLIAKMAGYTDIEVFDVNPHYIDLCRKLWGDDGVSYSVKDSKAIKDFNEYQGFDVLIPDWWHGNQETSERESAQLILCTRVDDFFFHRKKLSFSDYIDYFSCLDNYRFQFGRIE